MTGNRFMNRRNLLLAGAVAPLAAGLLQPLWAQSADSLMIDDPDAPVLGNPKGDVTLVEFFDVQCTYCKRAHPIVERLISSDPGLRVVMRDWVIYGDVSYHASRLLLASQAQGLYPKALAAVMTYRGRLSPQVTTRLLDESGVDLALAEEWLTRHDRRVNGLLHRNEALAQQIGVMGTPSFVIGQHLVPGLLSFDQFTRIIAQVRADDS